MNGGKNIKPEISLFLGFGGREDNNKCVQLEISYVANTKEYILVKNSGKNIRPKIGLFLGFGERENNNKHI